MIDYPGGYDSLTIRELLDSVVTSHTSKGMSSEKMTTAARLEDLRYVHSVLVQSAFLIRALIEEKEGVFPLGGSSVEAYKRDKTLSAHTTKQNRSASNRGCSVKGGG